METDTVFSEDNILKTDEQLPEADTVPESAEPDSAPDNAGQTTRDQPPDIPELDTNSAIKDLLRQSRETKAELAETRNLFQKIFEREIDSANRASEDDFVTKVRERYQADPFQGASMLVGKAREDLSKLMDQKIFEALGAREQFNQLMDDFLEDPAHNSLKSFRNELEYLIRDRGVEPKQAANFLKTIEAKARKAVTQKTETMSEVRKRATTESGARPLEAPDQDRELTRAFKQARNLDEMFTALKRTRL